MSIKDISTTVMDKAKTLKAEIEQKRAELYEEAKNLFEQVLKEDVHLLKGVTIYWEQYTPYFNDGDACYFRMGDVWITNATRDQIVECEYIGYLPYDNPDDDLWVEYSPSAADDYLEPAQKEFLGELHQFIRTNSDLMEEIFGDHSSIFITEEGVFVEENTDHD